MGRVSRLGKGAAGGVALVVLAAWGKGWKSDKRSVAAEGALAENADRPSPTVAAAPAARATARAARKGWLRMATLAREARGAEFFRNKKQ